MTIPPGDKNFVTRVLMPYFHIPKLRMSWSDSKARWPDIWSIRGFMPAIIVTREWLRQGMHERRKRLVHEMIHLGWKLEHGIHQGLVYSTIPAEDMFSWKVYRDIVSRHNPGRLEEKDKVLVSVKPIKKEEEKEISKKGPPPPSTPLVPRRWRPNPLYELYPLYFKSKEDVQAIIDEWAQGDLSGRVRQDFKPVEDEFGRWRLAGVQRKMQHKPLPRFNPSQRIYDRYLKEIRKKWDWPGIVRNLQAREDLKPAHEEYPVYYYLGSYLKTGPDAVERGEQHFYEKIWHYPGMGSHQMAGYRLGEWLTALVDVAEEHGLHIYIPDEDPADLYVTLGVSRRERAWHGVDKIEGF